MASTVLDNEKLALVDEHRRRVADVLPEFKNDYRRHDANLVKFLIARDFNLDKAEDMLRRNLEWRKQNDANNLRHRPICAELQRYYSFKLVGFDRVGRPVLVAPVGQWNAIGAVQAGLKRDARIMLMQFCETIWDVCEELSTDNSMIVSYALVLDLGGFDYKTLANKEVFNLFRELLSILLNNYPENMCSITIVNAPRVFAMAWSLVKPLLTARSLSKIHIFGGKQEEWGKHLLERISEDNLPSQYGGANTSCYATTRFEIGPGLISILPVEMLPEGDFVSRYVEPGKLIIVEVCVDAGDLIMWNFKTEAYDIGFQVDYEDLEPIIPFSRVDSYKFVQKGVISCDVAGKYKITFDNTYSLMTGKMLKYAIKTKAN